MKRLWLLANAELVQCFRNEMLKLTNKLANIISCTIFITTKFDKILIISTNIDLKYQNTYNEFYQGK